MTRMPDPSRELAPLPGPGATPTDAAGLEAGDPEPVAARAVRTSLHSRCCRPPSLPLATGGALRMHCPTGALNGFPRRNCTLHGKPGGGSGGGRGVQSARPGLRHCHHPRSRPD